MTLPNFLVIGGSKCGTTSIHFYMLKHPEIFLCPKETHFFAYDGKNDMDIKAKSLADYERLFSRVANELAIGEVAIDYLTRPISVQNIKSLIPGVKLIASLRDPSSRAFSHFLMHCRLGNLQARDGSTLPARPSVEQIEELFEDPQSFYIRQGNYYRDLRRFYDSFPREQISVYLLEDLERNPTTIMQEMFRFLGVDDTFVPDTSIRYNVAREAHYNRALMMIRSNKALIRLALKAIPQPILDAIHRRRKTQRAEEPRVRPVLPPHIRKRLIDLYREDTLRLQDLIQEDLSEWLDYNSLSHEETRTTQE